MSPPHLSSRMQGLICGNREYDVCLWGRAEGGCRLERLTMQWLLALAPTLVVLQVSGTCGYVCHLFDPSSFYAALLTFCHI